MISDIMTVRRSAVPYSSQTTVPLLGNEPGDGFTTCICPAFYAVILLINIIK